MLDPNKESKQLLVGPRYWLYTQSMVYNTTQIFVPRNLKTAAVVACFIGATTAKGSVMSYPLNFPWVSRDRQAKVGDCRLRIGARRMADQGRWSLTCWHAGAASPAHGCRPPPSPNNRVVGPYSTFYVDNLVLAALVYRYDLAWARLLF